MRKGIELSAKRQRYKSSSRRGISGVIIGLAIVSVILIASGAGLAYWRSSQYSSQTADAVSKSTKTTTPDFGGDANWSVSVPKGWKNLETKQLDISFTVPKAWTAVEQYKGLCNGTVGVVTIGSSEEFKDKMIMMIVSTDLDTYTKQAESLYKKYSTGVTTNIEKGTWHGYAARKVTIHSNDPNDAVTLFVRIGKYTYQLPYVKSYQSNVVAGKFNPADYKKFVESIRIKNK